MTNKDKEAVIDENEGLRQELAMYKSVGVPADSKPRTFVTRITRAPLTNHSLNVGSVTEAKPGLKKSDGAERPVVPSTEYRGGDMTLDEIA